MQVGEPQGEHRVPNFRLHLCFLPSFQTLTCVADSFFRVLESCNGSSLRYCSPRRICSQICRELSGTASAMKSRSAEFRLMSEYKKQSAFLKKLMLIEDSAENRALLDRLCQVERSEKCLQYACRLVGLIALLGLAGFGYAAVLLPQFFDNSTHFVIRLCSAVGLGSCLCFAIFLALWYSYRRIANRIHSESRLVILRALSARFPSAAAGSLPVIHDQPQVKIEVLRETVEISTLLQGNTRKAS